MTVEDHLSLYGITKSKPIAKKIIEAFEEDIEESDYQVNEEIIFQPEEKVTEEINEPTGTQFTLDSF